MYVKYFKIEKNITYDKYSLNFFDRASEHRVVSSILIKKNTNNNSYSGMFQVSIIYIF